MSILDSPSYTLATVIEEPPFKEAEVAAAAFLARYSGRTLDAYRYDLRTFFQWASDAHVPVLEAQRPHIELYRISMEERELAPSTIDRRLSTVCGFYRFTHIDGRIAANPAQSVRRPWSILPQGGVLIAGSSAPSRWLRSGATRTTLPWPPRSGSMASGSARPATRMSRILPLPVGTGPFTSSARATSRRLCHLSQGQPGPSNS